MTAASVFYLVKQELQLRVIAMRTTAGVIVSYSLRPAKSVQFDFFLFKLFEV
jgi:hypothetical protein